MHPYRMACLFQMGVQNISYQHAMRLHTPHVSKGGIFVRTTPLRMLSIPPLKMLGGCARMRIVLPGGNEQMQVRLLVLFIQRRGIMEGVRDGELVTGDRVDQVVHEVHVLAMTQLLG